jgi:hypothetical protein
MAIARSVPRASATRMGLTECMVAQAYGMDDAGGMCAATELQAAVLIAC